MMPIRRPALDDGPGQAWCAKARLAMASLVATYQPGSEVSLNDELYKEAKPFLMSLTHDKCAYCESLISNTHPGDVEHYRPKGRVRDEDGRIARALLKDAEADHPGYWWLAYEWSNLLPCCIHCNRSSAHGPDKLVSGKADHFAVRGSRAVRPDDDLIKEDALLLDPAEEGFDPAAHFDFQPDGLIKPKTAQAEYSCRVLGLNREKLVEERRRAFVEAKRALNELVADVLRASDEQLEETRRDINRMWEGHTPHTAFARAGIDSVREKLRQHLRYPLEMPLR